VEGAAFPTPADRIDWTRSSVVTHKLPEPPVIPLWQRALWFLASLLIYLLPWKWWRRRKQRQARNARLLRGLKTIAAQAQEAPPRVE
jgi:membrane protein implicated in regulation of membrane protease activity